jgi:hypothetical protein
MKIEVNVKSLFDEFQSITHHLNFPFAKTPQCPFTFFISLTTPPTTVFSTFTFLTLNK